MDKGLLKHIFGRDSPIELSILAYIFNEVLLLLRISADEDKAELEL